MPTTKSRISITFDDETISVLDRYAAASGTPRASVVSQIIASTSSELEKAARMMELANAATPELLRKINSDLGEATNEAMRQLLPVDDQYRGLIRKVSHRVEWQADKDRKRLPGTVPVTAAGGARAGAGKRRPPRSDPHLLTGGSKP